MMDMQFLDELTAYLVSQECQDLLGTHPNHATSRDFRCPNSWRHWWTWAADPTNVSERKWLVLWRYYASPDQAESSPDFAHIPAQLRAFIDCARRLQLNRTMGEDATPLGAVGAQHPRSFPLPSKLPVANANVNTHGMSPKKAHEVLAMTGYTSRLLSSLMHRGTSIRHVVDIGAGQAIHIWRSPFVLVAYVTRALRDELGLDILALDWSSVQAEGAARRDEAPSIAAKQEQSTGSLTYKTIPIDKGSLLAATDEWLSEEAPQTLPVLLLALHACGSLTLDVLRAFCERVKNPEEKAWRPAAALVVGCCYNLLRAEDCVSLTGREISITANHRQLAAQVPRYWDRTPKSFEDAKLAIRKVAWRALLEGVLAQKGVQDGRRLGRLNDSAYRSWETFLSVAEKKLAVELQGTVLDPALESQIEVLQLLRCLLGPVLESFLLLDRKAWLSRELQDTCCTVGLVNLFDQGLDSARNVAIVVTCE